MLLASTMLISALETTIANFYSRFFAVGKVIKNVGSSKQYSVFEYSRGRFPYYFYKYVLTIVFVDSLTF